MRIFTLTWAPTVLLLASQASRNAKLFAPACTTVNEEGDTLTNESHNISTTLVSGFPDGFRFTYEVEFRVNQEKMWQTNIVELYDKGENDPSHSFQIVFFPRKAILIKVSSDKGVIKYGNTTKNDEEIAYEANETVERSLLFEHSATSFNILLGRLGDMLILAVNNRILGDWELRSLKIQYERSLRVHIYGSNLLLINVCYLSPGEFDFKSNSPAYKETAYDLGTSGHELPFKINGGKEQCTIFYSTEDTIAHETTRYVKLEDAFWNDGSLLIEGFREPSALEFSFEILTSSMTVAFRLDLSSKNTLITSSEVARNNWSIQAKSRNKWFGINDTFSLVVNKEACEEKEYFLVRLNDIIVSKLEVQHMDSLEGPSYIRVLGCIRRVRNCQSRSRFPRQSRKNTNTGSCPTVDRTYDEPACIIFFNVSQSSGQIPKTTLPNGFEEGKMVTIKGSVKQVAYQLVLAVHISGGKVAFHMKVDFKTNIIALSQKLTRNWYRQASSPNIWFKSGEAFQLDIYRKNGDLLIQINASLIARFSTAVSKEQLADVSYLVFSGDVFTVFGCYKNNSPELPKLPTFEPSSLLHDDCWNKWSEMKLYHVPYMKLPEELSYNRSLVIHLTPYIFKDRFVVNLFSKDNQAGSVLHLKADDHVLTRKYQSLASMYPQRLLVTSRCRLINKSNWR